ncbi:MAG: hypothetical protein ACRD0K_07430 [Egibacteraceae bacterium]
MSPRGLAIPHRYEKIACFDDAATGCHMRFFTGLQEWQLYHLAGLSHQLVVVARTLLGEIYTSPADLQIIGDALHVRIHPLSAPRRARALAGLCAELTATRTVYPGTNLTLVYTVQDR